MSDAAFLLSSDLVELETMENEEKTRGLGLTSEEAEERARQGLSNRTSLNSTKSIPAIIKENAFTIFNGLNFVLGIMIISMGAYKNALFLVTVIFNLTVGIVNQIRAKKILDECTQKHVDAYEENKTVKGHATVVWLSILGFLSLPVSLPLAAVVLALVITVIVVIIAVLISLAATAVALVIAGAASLVVMWMAPGIAQKAAVFGIGLCSLSIGILMCFGIFYMVRGIFRRLFRRNNVEKETEQ